MDQWCWIRFGIEAVSVWKERVPVHITTKPLEIQPSFRIEDWRVSQFVV